MRIATYARRMWRVIAGGAIMLWLERHHIQVALTETVVHDRCPWCGACVQCGQDHDPECERPQ